MQSPTPEPDTSKAGIEINPWTGKYLSRSLESAFMRWSWGEFSWVVQAFLWAAIAMIWIFAPSDVHFVGYSDTLYMLLAMRVIATALAGIAILVVRGQRRPAFLSYALTPWLWAMGALVYTISLTRPADHLAGLLQSIGAVIAVLLVVPVDIRRTAVSTMLFSLALVITTSVRLTMAGEAGAYTVVLPIAVSFLFANFVGYVLALRWARLRREAFAGRLNDRKLRRALLQEIKQRRRIESELVTATLAAEKASRAKSEFLSSMSHELRTPLNAIINYAALLRDDLGGFTNAQAIEDITRIDSSGRHLLGLINQVLDLGKIEAGRTTVNARTFRLVEFTQALTSTLQILVPQNENELRLDWGHVEGDVYCDDTMLRQILINVAANALKFTQNGTVTVTLAADPQMLEFRVADTGIGMTPHQVGLVFEPFEQAGPLTHHVYGGTGLGLSISRKLVTLLGGTINAASQPGKGSTFTICIPRRYQPPADTTDDVTQEAGE